MALVLGFRHLNLEEPVCYVAAEPFDCVGVRAVCLALLDKENLVLGFAKQLTVQHCALARGGAIHVRPELLVNK